MNRELTILKRLRVFARMTEGCLQSYSYPALQVIIYTRLCETLATFSLSTVKRGQYENKIFHNSDSFLLYSK